MRASADTFWLTGKDLKDFCDYESQIDNWIIDQAMSVLCTYPLAKSGAAEILDVMEVHQFATARRQGEWQVIETPELGEAQAEIKRLNEELEQRVNKRTRELIATNEALKIEIIERKRVEDELRERAADLAEAQHVAKIGNWILNVRTNKINWSDQLYRIFEIEKGDFDGLYESFVSRMLNSRNVCEKGTPSTLQPRGLEMTAHITKEFPTTRVIIFSFDAKGEHARRALSAGASGFLLKSTTRAEFETAVNSVARGRTYVSPSVDYRRHDRQEELLPALTSRQRQILQLIAEGQSTKRIALTLNISAKTVETHRAQLMDRLDIHNIVGLVRYAINNGLIQLEN